MSEQAFPPRAIESQLQDRDLTRQPLSYDVVATSNLLRTNPRSGMYAAPLCELYAITTTNDASPYHVRFRFATSC